MIITQPIFLTAAMTCEDATRERHGNTLRDEPVAEMQVGRHCKESEMAEQSNQDRGRNGRLPVSEDFGPKDAQLPFHDANSSGARPAEAARGKTVTTGKVHTDPPPDRPPSKVDDAAFLADQFDVPVAEAAELVASRGEGQEAAEIQEATNQRLRDEDALEGLPTPREPAHEHVADSDEVRLKPVLHSGNERNGAG
jgi:hypothetical protein